MDEDIEGDNLGLVWMPGEGEGDGSLPCSRPFEGLRLLVGGDSRDNVGFGLADVVPLVFFLGLLVVATFRVVVMVLGASSSPLALTARGIGATFLEVGAL